MAGWEKAAEEEAAAEIEMRNAGGIPWRSSGEDGEDSTLPMQGPRVPALVRELRSHMPHGAAKKKKKREMLN